MKHLTGDRQKVVDDALGELTATYRAMVMAREVDRAEARLVASGEAFFHVSGGGHEASALLAPYLTPADYLHCHYRDKALMLARGITPASFIHSVLCTHASHSRGRQMSAHMSEPALHVLSTVGPVGNNALQAVGVGAALKERGEDALVFCAFGDGTTQEGEVLEAVIEAARHQLPLLFVVHDNGWAISTKTAGRTFYDIGGTDAASYVGIPIRYADGRRPWLCDEPLRDAVAAIRDGQGPQIVVLRCERLGSHTNADDDKVYRSDTDREAANATGDPLANFRAHLCSLSPSAEEQLDAIDADVKAIVKEAVAIGRAALTPGPLEEEITPTPAPGKAPLRQVPAAPAHTMGDAIRETLNHLLALDERVILTGQDIEDPKGDVFGITRGLSTAYPGRVTNSCLSESTITGTCIGRAMAGQRPIGFLQFADFLPLAYNQIATEMGAMHWRTDGGWQVPMILMMPCGGYRPGLGPFHAHTFESIVTHVPGVDVIMPSHAEDAAGLLLSAYDSGRPTIYLYPKALLNARDRMTDDAITTRRTTVGSACIERRGREITLVAWGNAVEVCRRACVLLDSLGVDAELIDLRSLVPWDQAAVIDSAEKTGRLIVVHEDNHTCGFGAEILATVGEHAARRIAMARVTRPDVYVPCNFADQLATLPSARRVVDTAARLLGIKLEWQAPAAAVDGVHVVEAQSSSPSDESLTIIDWHVAPGDAVEAGDVLADMEAEKAAFELMAPIAGEVIELLAEPGATVPRGTPIATIATGADSGPKAVKIVTREEPGTPIRVGATAARSTDDDRSAAPAVTVKLLAAIGAVTGDREVSNDEILAKFDDVSHDDVVQRTGIHSRRWCAEAVSAASFGARAANALFAKSGLGLSDFDALICATTTPDANTPSTACLILEELAETHGLHEMPAHDLSAACSGWLYALAQAHDMIRAGAAKRVLVVTTEIISRYLRPENFDTVILFGDAATATAVCADTSAPAGQAAWSLTRPVLNASAKDANIIRLSEAEGVAIEGGRVFKEAVRGMTAILNQACGAQGLAIEDLEQLVPHQANARILDAITSRVNLPAESIVKKIDGYGNTSSSSIPLALALTPGSEGKTIGLVAFGGGLTYGAGLLIPDPS